MLASTPVYVVSSMEPQWRFNDRALRGPQVQQAEGCLWYLVKSYLTCMLLPAVAAWKFCTNILPALTERRPDTSAQDGRPDAAPLGRGSATLVLISLAVVVAVVVYSLVSVPSEPTGATGAPRESSRDSGDISNGAQPESGEPPPRSENGPPETSTDRRGTEPSPAGDADRTAATADDAEPGGSTTAPPTAPVPEDSSADAADSLAPGLSATTTQPQVPQEPVRVGGNVTAPTKVRHVPPVYPPAARQMRAQGVVILEAVIGTTGDVETVRVIRSVALLDDAAIAAVRQWRYTPTLLNDLPVPVVMTVTVNFTLQ